MNIYHIKYYEANGTNWIAPMFSVEIEEVIKHAERQLKEWNDDTTYTILVFKLIKELKAC